MGGTFLYLLSNDKSSGSGFGCEHGLSVCISTDNGGLWLWDTGQSRLFLDSAARLRLDLGKLNGLALSHGHYDHADGLAALIGDAEFHGPVFGHPLLARQRYKKQAGSAPLPIGFGHALSLWPPSGFNEVCHFARLDEGLMMFTDIPRRPGLFQSVEGYSFDLEETRPDSVQDDACLALQTQKGIVIILGCCHSGLANTLYRVRDLTGIKKVYSVFGGFHLLAAPEDALRETADVLREFCVQRIYPCHCSGEKAVLYFKQHYSGKVFEIGTGTVVQF
jgi:7,8-dihydropterin-6-yl-methyl-4-(beta-D-ribofuranosyl)aminobenzene 5'-phosphate synthase